MICLLLVSNILRFAFWYHLYQIITYHHLPWLSFFYIINFYSWNHTTTLQIAPKSTQLWLTTCSVGGVETHLDNSIPIQSYQPSEKTLEHIANCITIEHSLHQQKQKIKKKMTKIPTFSKTEEKQLIGLLKTYGSDFSLIATLMKKTRTQILRKFKYFEKKQPSITETIFERVE